MMDCGEERGALVDNTPLANMDILRSLVDFVPPTTQFLFFAPVSRCWFEAWGRWQKRTSLVTPDSSPSQLAYSFENGLRRNEKLCAAIARLGNLDFLQHVRLRGCPWDYSTCAGAAEGGHFAVLKWARMKGCHWRTSSPIGGRPQSAAESAAKGGHLDVLRWAMDNGCGWNAATCSSAASGGHLEVLK